MKGSIDRLPFLPTLALFDNLTEPRVNRLPGVIDPNPQFAIVGFKYCILVGLLPHITVFHGVGPPHQHMAE
jgi:hypothetical protein